jgi:DNA-binding transcriptional regulator YhcF (GntR family)
MKGGSPFMRLDQHSTIPIYMQIAAWLETEILKGNFKADEKVYSQYQLADLFHINPATAAKGLTLLGQENIVYDKRGLGKFVAKDAIQIIRKKRKDNVLQKLIEQVVEESMNLGISESDLTGLVTRVYREKEGKRNGR